MRHVEKFAADAVKMRMKTLGGGLFPKYKELKFVCIEVYEENDTCCLIDVIISARHKDDGKRRDYSGFQVWKKGMFGWKIQDENDKSFKKYLLDDDGEEHGTLWGASAARNDELIRTVESLDRDGTMFHFVP